jgi:hypothetical protein
MSLTFSRRVEPSVVGYRIVYGEMRGNFEELEVRTSCFTSTVVEYDAAKGETV